MRYCLLCVLCVAMLASPGACYNPPGSGDPVANPNAHGKIALKALDVLHNDGKTNVEAFFNTHIYNLVKGTREADTGGGEFTIAGQAVPKNSFTHFYNPATGKGFVLDMGEYNCIKNGLSFLSLIPWKYCTLKGPHPSMSDMADYYYAKAVREMKANNKAMAMEYLGYVLHYVSDATVPQHVCDEGAQKPGSNHVNYENACDTYALSPSFPHANSGGSYRGVDWTPGRYVRDVASYSRPLLSKAKDPSQYYSAASQMIPLAERYCAGVLNRFYLNWNTEQFRMVAVKVERIKAIDYWIPSRDLDNPDDADFYAYVKIDGKTYETSIVDGTDDMSPNTLVPYAWFFPKWISGNPSSIRIEIAVWDDDGITGDDKAYICPKKNEKELWIDYNLSTGAVSRDTSATASGSITSVYARGNHSSGDEAEIWFTVERLP